MCAMTNPTRTMPVTAITTFLPTMVPHSTTIGLVDQKPRGFRTRLRLSLIDRFVADLLFCHRYLDDGRRPAGEPARARPERRSLRGARWRRATQPAPDSAPDCRSGADRPIADFSGQQYYQIILRRSAKFAQTVESLAPAVPCKSMQGITKRPLANQCWK